MLLSEHIVILITDLFLTSAYPHFIANSISAYDHLLTGGTGGTGTGTGTGNNNNNNNNNNNGGTGTGKEFIQEKSFELIQNPN